jgi:hypothetical protein
MGTKSKFFRAFVEGQTISDGRKIEGPWIDQIVDTFHAETYTPRINVEHLSGYSPEPPFNGYGSVIAVKAQTDDITIAGTVEKRRALYCQVDANDQLVALVAANQKPYPSVELTPSYAGTDKIGLIGLAFTDKPASIATESLQFSRSSPGTLFAAASEGVPLDFEAEPTDPVKVEGAIAGFFSALAATLRGGKAEPAAPAVETPPVAANDNFDAAAFTTQLGTAVASSIAAAVKPMADGYADLQGKFATLEAKLEATPATGFSRTPANGGDGEPITDC